MNGRTAGQYGILRTLQEANRDLPASEIAERADCAESTVHNNIDALVDEGRVRVTRTIDKARLFEHTGGNQ